MIAAQWVAGIVLIAIGVFIIELGSQAHEQAKGRPGRSRPAFAAAH